MTYDSYNSWTIPLNMAIVFHVFLATSIVFLPGLLKSRPKYEDIYTVNLIEFAEPAPQQPAAPPPQTAAEPEPEPLKTEAKEVVLEPVKTAPAPQEVKAVSIKPLKRKIKKEVVKQPDQAVERQKQLEVLRRQSIAEALRAEKLAAEQAQLAAEEAERQQKLLEQQLAAVRNQVRSSQKVAPSRPAGSQAAQSGVMGQYNAALINHVTRYWSLPEFKNWDPNLLAVVVITIGKDGRIVKQFFEKRSGDSAYDQYVRKTLQDADPLPPIPAALRKDQIEIGIRFRPGSIQ
ncbi:MAG: energy transducer TonB [Desulfocapsaceae bacterium]|nr:energy transducer TonB [Desulfocapsaceae bacterium]